MTLSDSRLSAPSMRPGNTIVQRDGSEGVVVATWSGTVVYEQAGDEQSLRGEEIEHFVEVDQGRWRELSPEELERLEREKVLHLSEYRTRLQRGFLEGETYLESTELSEEVRRVLLQEKIDFIRDWASGFSSKLPDREQAEAIGTIAGNVLVTARAGSGKTLTLVNRALFLITQCAVAPENILLLAFNRKAALEVRQKILAIINPDAAKRVKSLVRGKIQDGRNRKGRLDPVDIESRAIDSVVEGAGIRLPHTMTFHALAHRIVHPTEEMLFDDKEGTQRQSRVVQQIIDSWLSDPIRHDQIRDVMLEHFREDWENIVRHGYDKDREAFLKYRRSIVTETLNGEYVKSFGEKVIADFLFEHGLPYQYERNYRKGSINYKPDFTIFLSPHDRPAPGQLKEVVIEYFGLAGDPDYDELSAEKREYWSEREDVLFLEYTPRNIPGGDAEALRYQIKEDLEAIGIACTPLSDDEVWRLARRRLVDNYSKAVRSFVSRCRKLALTPHGLEALIAQHEQSYETEAKFYEVAGQIYADYLRRLEAVGEEDFDGLILRAEEAVHAGKTVFSARAGAGDLSELSHLCVDEFQDFSELFFRLLRAIQEQNPAINLFCVGDDWQAINGFAGSDLKYFLKFSDYFEAPSYLTIATNYRSCASIVDVGNQLMRGLGNPSHPYTEEEGSITLADMSAFSPSTAERRRFGGDEITPAVLRLIYASLGSDESIGVLARRNGLPYFFALPKGAKGADLAAFERSLTAGLPPGLGRSVTVSTAHSFKGLERDKVIVIDAVDRSYPLIHPNWVFSRLFGDDLDTVVDAERRLFYVALTRAIKDLVVVTDGRRPSEFLTELQRRVEFGRLRWDKYRPAPMPDTEVYVCLRNRPGGRRSGTGTYPIRNQINACGYRFHSGKSPYWRKSVPHNALDVDTILKEAWVEPAMGVDLVIENQHGEPLQRYEIDNGRWREVDG